MKKIISIIITLVMIATIFQFMPSVKSDYGDLYQFGSGYYDEGVSPKVVALNSQYIVVAYSSTSNGGGVVKIGNITNNSIAYGDGYVFCNGDDYTIYQISLARLDDNSFVIAYTYNDWMSMDDYASVRVCTVSGTEITIGDETTFDYSVRNYAIAVSAFNSSCFIIAYSGTEYLSPTASRVVTVSGTDMNLGEEFMFSSTDVSTTYTGMSSTITDGSHFVLAYQSAGGPYHGYCVVGEVSDYNITYGSELAFYNDSWAVSIGIDTLDSSHVAICFNDPYGSSNASVIVGTISDTSISYGDKFTSGIDGLPAISVYDSNNFVLTMGDRGESVFNGTSIQGYFDGTDITFSNRQMFYEGKIPWYNSVDFLSPSYVVVFNEEDGYTGQSVILEYLLPPVSLTWNEVADHSPLGSRTMFGATVFDDKMWIVGGTAYGTVYNDVWSSLDGILWTRENSDSAWNDRYNFGVATFNGKMWVMGGILWSLGGEWLDNDVWSSTDGVNWTLETADANWSERDGFTTLVYDNKMWLIGGTNGVSFFNDVWYTEDGINWTLANATASFSGRAVPSSLVFDNKMWLLGGAVEGAYLNDVWYSTDGADWFEATSDAGWSDRGEFGAVVLESNMYIFGGWDGVDNFNDTWYSSDGVTWTETTNLSGWEARHSFQSLIYDEEIWVLLGVNLDYSGDIWYTGDPIIYGDNTTIPNIKMTNPQYPNPTGWDVGLNTWGQPIMADDWQCSETGFVTGIHFWISYYNDLYIDIPLVDVAIWSDNAGYPSVLLWNATFFDFNVSGPYYGDEGFIINDGVYEHNHLTFYRIDIENIPEPFVQWNGSIYWLALTVPWMGDPYYPGWKTTTNISLSPAVYGPYDGWFRISDPLTLDPLSLAFVITGEPIELGDNTPFPYAKMETIQRPNPNGWDTWFNWWYGGYLADDWMCNETGNVTGIHFWVSWYNDVVSEIPSINVSIESDAPGIPNTILWSRDFATEDFTVTGPYYGDEGFAFAGDAYYEHNHQKFWRINIENITNPFVQENGTTYWLALKLPVDLYVGWKTSVNDTLNSAMYGGIEGWYVINNPTPPYEAFDFSFVITDSPLANQPPEFSNENPVNGSIGQPVDLTWSIDVTDYEGDLMDINISCSNGQYEFYDDWADGTFDIELSGLDYLTTYTVWVNATDGTDWTRAWYIFTTMGNPNVPPDMPSNPTPTNNSDYESVYNRYLNVTVSDPDGGTVNTSFYWGNHTFIGMVLNVPIDTNASLFLPDVLSPDWLDHDTAYYWYVDVSDGMETVTSPTWNFHTSKAWDCNEDRNVSYLDVSIVVSNYGLSGYLFGEIPADIIEDGDVNYLDVSSLVSHYGEVY